MMNARKGKTKETTIIPKYPSKLNLADNNIGEKGKKALAEINPNICTVSFSY